MATITNYTTLVQAILDVTHRSDLSTFVDYFIQQAQDTINNDIFMRNMGNGIRAMEGPFTATISGAGNVGVPSDWLAPKDIQIVDSAGNVDTLVFKDAAWMYDVFQNRQASGLPAYIARDNTVFIFGPYPDAAYNLQGTYYLKAAQLSSGTATNWMITETPWMLQAACMKNALAFIKDSEGMALWDSIYQSQLQALIDRDTSERWAGATMQVELG